jgi:hypothetical protein
MFLLWFPCRFNIVNLNTTNIGKNIVNINSVNLCCSLYTEYCFRYLQRNQSIRLIGWSEWWKRNLLCFVFLGSRVRIWPFAGASTRLTPFAGCGECVRISFPGRGSEWTAIMRSQGRRPGVRIRCASSFFVFFCLVMGLAHGGGGGGLRLRRRGGGVVGV